MSQSDLINCVGDSVLSKIIEDVKVSQFFGLQAAEITVTIRWALLGLALHYIKNNKPVERTVSYTACEVVMVLPSVAKYLTLSSFMN